MRSPQKIENKRPGKFPTAKATKKGRARFRKNFLWLFVPIIFYGLYLSWQKPAASRQVPEELLGTWTTSSTEYAGRYLQFEANSVSFGTGPGMISRGFIEGVEAVPHKDRTLYTVDYQADGTEEIFSFYYTNGRKHTIVFKNRSGIKWTKIKENAE